MIVVHGVNKRQIRILNKIWEMDEPEEYREYVNSLTLPERLEVGTLVQLMILSEIDEAVEKSELEWSKKMLNHIGIKTEK